MQFMLALTLPIAQSFVLITALRYAGRVGMLLVHGLEYSSVILTAVRAKLYLSALK
jgi:hypothetical protein